MAGLVAGSICSRNGHHLARPLPVDDQRVLFVSFENWRGPLSITLGRSIDQLRALNVGDTAAFVNHRLIFPATEITLSPHQLMYGRHHCPSCPLPDRSTTRHPATDRPYRHTRAPDRGFGPLLSPLLDLPLAARCPLIKSRYSVFCTHCNWRCATRCGGARSIDPLLGRGAASPHRAMTAYWACC